MATINERIKEQRLLKDINQPQLAKILNVSKQTVSNWENGNRIPDVTTLSNLADFFGCTVDYLLGRADDPNTKVYETTIDGNKYEIGLDKAYPYDLSPEDVKKLITQLKEVGFDVDKLIQKAKTE